MTKEQRGDVDNCFKWFKESTCCIGATGLLRSDGLEVYCLELGRRGNRSVVGKRIDGRLLEIFAPTRVCYIDRLGELSKMEDG